MNGAPGFALSHPSTRVIRGLAVLVGALALLGPVSPASATTITNGTVTLGVNPQGNLNSSDELGGFFGVNYNLTGNDGTRGGCPCEGWGAGAGGATPFEARANQSTGNDGYAQVSFTPTPSSAVSVVDILRDGIPALRLTQDFHPSPTTPNLYEITTALENISGGLLNDVRYERIMDWDVEPTATSEFVTINRGSTPPSNLIYSDDNGFANNYPFSDRTPAGSDGPLDPATVNVNYVDRGPSDHGARFTFSFGDLAAGARKEFFVYYGAAGSEPGADSAVSAAALEVFSYGQPNVPDGDDPDTLADGPEQGKPNTFIWGFRGVGGQPVIPPTLTLSPKSATSTVGDPYALTATLRGSGGTPIPGAEVVFVAAGANSATGSRTTDTGGQAGFSYTGAAAGNDTITACLDGNSNGGCDPGEVSDTAGKTWRARATQEILGTEAVSPPVQGSTVNIGLVSGKVRYKRRGSKRYVELSGIDQIPVGSTVDATKGRVRLTSAADKKGKTKVAEFYKGAFVVKQSKRNPLTELKLEGGKFNACPKAGKASASAKKRVRRLFGSGKGSFRTRGRNAAATVRGTTWVTEDFCDGTRVQVNSGVVKVRDLVKKKNFTVRKGKSYFARAR